LTYTIGIERGDLNYAELEPNYRQHYAEMKERLERDGIVIGDYNPRLDTYFDAFRSGWLLNYVARFNGKPVGHCNIYVTNDMHNGEKIATEDVLYVLPQHRNGLGRKMAKYMMADLKARGVKRFFISPVTDLRVGKVWKRMGFREVAMQMMYNVED